MPNKNATPENPMTLLELIELIGDVLTEIDVLSVHFKRGTEDRIKLDDLRDELDGYQRKLVRKAIKDNTAEFKKHTASLKAVNEDLKKTIDKVDKIATTLETLVKFVAAVQKIAELAP
jgi:chromosome segregation ATPase